MEALPKTGNLSNEPISRTRIGPPVLAGHTIERPRLFSDDLDQLFLGVLVAPAGYGKTTAALQLVSAIDAEVCWLTIEPDTTDVDRFKAYVAAALGLLGPADEDAVLDPTALQAATDRLRIGAIQLDRPTVLVLDDFHEITNPELLRSIGEWIVVPVPNLSLLCVGRTEPELPLDKIRSQGRLLELRRSELAFTSAEATATLHGAFGMTAPDPPTIEEIVAATEGWPAVVYLAALDATTESLSNAAQSPVPRAIERYIWSEAFVDLPDETLAFMTTTSVTEAIHPDLGNVLCETTTSINQLRALVDNEQFTSVVDPAEPTFRYHPLVRQLLLERLASSNSSDFEELHRRAAEWLRQHDQLTAAIRCATSSRDVALGQQLVAYSWRSRTRHNNFAAVQEWAQAVGPDGTANGLVSLILAWGAVAVGDETGMHRWLTRAGAFATGRTTAEVVRIASHLILAEWANRTGNIGSMNTHLAEAVEITGPLTYERYEDPGTTALHGATFCMLGTAVLLSGNDQKALPILVDVVAFSRQPDHEHTLSYALNYLALHDALGGRYAYALEHTDEIIDRIERQEMADAPHASMAYLARSIVYLGRGDDAAANTAIEFAVEILGDADGYPVQRGLVELQLARLLHRRGALSQARDAVTAARQLARASGPSLLDRHIRSTENELRFLGLGPNDRLPPGARELTEREVEIVHLLPSSLSRGEIAQQLHISENTIKTHLTAISRKLNVRGRASIVERTRELGLLVTDPLTSSLTPSAPVGDSHCG